jgi:hypothetical protein
MIKESTHIFTKEALKDIVLYLLMNNKLPRENKDAVYSSFIEKMKREIGEEGIVDFWISGLNPNEVENFSRDFYSIVQ